MLFESLVPGGELITTEADDVAGAPGRLRGLSGLECAAVLEQAARDEGVELIYERVESLDAADGGFHLMSGGQPHRADAIILATGTRPRTLQILGEAEFESRGVCYCLPCEGPLMRNRSVAVVGEGEELTRGAGYLSQYAASVAVIASDGHVPSDLIRKVALPHVPIRVLRQMPVEVGGDKRVEWLRLRSEDAIEELAVDAVFVCAGRQPNSELVSSGYRNDKGFVVTGATFETPMPGLFAAGSVREGCGRGVDSTVIDGERSAFAVCRLGRQG